MSAKEVKRRRGTKAQNDAFTGADGELTVDSTKHRVRVHDASLAGGYSLLNANDIQNQAGVMGIVGGSANAITLTNDPPALSLTNLRVLFKATANNTGATTLTVDGLGAVAFRKFSGSSLVALSGGEIKNGFIYEAIHDGTYFQLGSGGGGGGVVINRTVYTSSGTHYANPNLLYADVEVQAGGGGSRSGSGGAGGAGGTSSLGSILIANGGAGGATGTSQSLGGTATGGDINIQGQNGAVYTVSSSTENMYLGGSSFLGFGAHGIRQNGQNYGGGASNAQIGGGSASNGAGGGYCRKIITKASFGVSQTVTVGASGAAGSGSPTGAIGAPGVVIITEYCSG